IKVERSGNAEYTPARSRGDAKASRRKLSSALAKRFYADLQAAKPLSGLPAAHCPKSASFGTTLTIESGDDVSPDLSCPAQRDPRAQNLARDANEIIKAFAAEQSRGLPSGRLPASR